MKFIFPQNYDFKNKLFGIIDYPTLFVNIVWFLLIFLICNFLFASINVKIFVFICFSLPLLLFSFSGFNGENIIYVFIYMYKFIIKQKLFFYQK